MLNGISISTEYYIVVIINILDAEFTVVEDNKKCLSKNRRECSLV